MESRKIRKRYDDSSCSLSTLRIRHTREYAFSLESFYQKEIVILSIREGGQEDSSENIALYNHQPKECSQ